MNTTPNANRLHIGVFGKCNCGKSSLINVISNQASAIVSDTKGTTTDPVFKAMEIHPIGPCVLIDTPGFDDTTALGKLRVEASKNATDRKDIAIMVFCDTDFEHEKQWLEIFRQKNIPAVAVINKADIIDSEYIKNKILQELNLNAITVSALNKTGIQELKEALVRLVPEDYEIKSITSHLVNQDDVVLLVMPQDIQAPKGRLILPQVQTIRDLLDNKCIVVSTTTDQLEKALLSLCKSPKLIITDSQVFDTVYNKKPQDSILTSFSALFARYKGDIDIYVSGAEKILELKETDTVLIAEACSHNALDGDIGREKIPAMLRKIAGEKLNVEIVSGVDFPKDLSKYSLIIHCGGCMFNRKYILSRIEKAVQQNIPITNYGIAIAKIKGILNKISY
ncbi:MAG: [Clostridia bacterium]|nr:[FeFe] hydrogenase H-cluster maturation GTPase HydF [Clostridia bacterium]